MGRSGEGEGVALQSIGWLVWGAYNKSIHWGARGVIGNDMLAIPFVYIDMATLCTFLFFFLKLGDGRLAGFGGSLG